MTSEPVPEEVGMATQEGLLAHLGEGVNTLADIHEVHGHILKLGLWMLVHHPHNLASVHSGAATNGDDAVRLESFNLLKTTQAILKLGVWGDGPEAGVNNALLVEGILNLLGEARLVQEGVGHDKCALLAVDLGKLAQGHGHAALLEEDLFGDTEPEHVLSPLCHGLIVEQVLGANVARDGVTTPGAAAQRKGGRKLEVIDIANTTLSSRSINQQTGKPSSSRHALSSSRSREYR